MKKQVKNGVIKVLILVLILAGAYGLWCHFLTDNVIWKKLKINGIAIQGMTKEEAIDAISKDFQEKYEDTQMTITLNGKNFKVSIYPVLGLDVKSIVESAYALGHGAWFTHGTDRIELMNSKTKEKVTLMPEARNKDELDKILEDAGISKGSTTIQTSCELTDTELVITKGKTGIGPRGEMTAKSRSDVNIIATVNTDTHEILLVSTPRDYFVPLSISGGAPDKLTHAGIYGIDVCMDTLGMLYDIDINYYFRINFGGFVKVIDALGGITVNSDYDFDSKNILGYHFNKGENYVNGEQALIFARERYAFQEGDRQRGKNQMEVIRGVVKKALSPEILTSYSSILSSLDGCFGTNITYEEIAQILQQQLTNGGDWTIVSYSVNGTGATEKPYSMSQKAYVMVPDYNTVDNAKSLMEKVRNGEVVTQEEADAPVSGSTSTDSISTEAVTEPGTVAAETQAATDTTAADGTTTEGTADTTTQQ